MATYLQRLLTVVLFVIAFAVPCRSQIIQNNFTSAIGWTLMSSARTVGGSLELTRSSYNLVGAAWYNVRQPVYRNWEASFQFTMSEQGGDMQYSFDSLGIVIIDTNGGDGIAFVIQNESTIALGREGGNMGYDPILNSIAIEFDTWPNYREESRNHVAVHVGGWASYNYSTLLNRYAYVDLDTMRSRKLQLDDGKIHTATIRYYGYVLSVYIDDCTNPVLRVPFRIDNLVFYPTGTAWVGLTSSTGSAIERHQVHNFYFNTYNTTDTLRSTQYACYGEPIIIGAPWPQYTWTWSGGIVADTITVSGPGRYYAICNEPFIYPNGCTSTNLVYVVDVLPIAIPSVSTNLKPINDLCGGDSINAVAMPSTYSRYEWYTLSGKTRFGSNAMLDTGTWYLRVTNSSGCDNEWGPYVVKSRGIPALRDTILYTCDSNATFVIQFPDNAYQYQWDNGSIFSPRVVGIGTYTYRIYGDSCFSNSANITIATYTKFPIPISSQNLCPGTAAVFDMPEDGSTYYWSDGLVGNSTILGPGQYWVYRISPEGCVSDTTFFNVTYTSPEKPIINLSDTLACEGDTIVAWIQNPDSFVTYTWFDGSVGNAVRITSKTNVYLDAITLDGCAIASDSSTVDFLKRDTIRVTLLSDTTPCGDSVVVTHNMVGHSVIWNNGYQGDTLVIKSPGVYGITLLDGDICDAIYDSITVLFNQPKQFFLYCNDSTLMTNDGRIADWYWNNQYIGSDSVMPGLNAGTYWAIDTSSPCKAYSDTITWNTATITIGNATVMVGDTFYIPVTVNTTSQASWTIRFKYRNLFPTNVPGWDWAVMPYRYIGSTAYSNTTFLLEFVSLFGDSSWTALEGNISIAGCGRVKITNGWVQIPEDCYTNPTLQTDTGGRTRIDWVQPNPTQGIISVGIYVGYDAGGIVFYMIDARGNIVKVFNDVAVDEGNSTHTYDLSTYASGTYWLVLADKWSSTSKMIQIQK